MRKQVFGRHLKRDTNERKALFKGLASSLVLHERIETTEQKAKAIKGSVEKLVTKAKTADEAHARKILERHLNSEAVKKMISDIAPRFAKRPGGYTRIVRVGRRFNDDATLVLLEWVEKKEQIVAKEEKKAVKTQKTETVASEAAVEKSAKAKKTTAAPKKKATTEKKTTKKPAKKETK